LTNQALDLSQARREGSSERNVRSKEILVAKALISIFSIEHGKLAYWADFAIYAVAVAILTIALPVFAPRAQWPILAMLAVLGAAAWTLIEYALHRFVLHGLEPFRGWHTAHHDRPTALMATPTLLSTSLIASLVFLPALWAAGFWRASALTLGVTAGYLAYALLHHATHHWRSRGPWMARRKRWHARHHHMAACYGVSSSFWDRVFGSTGERGTRS
jgi:sterol desaturase/sphingolipid hydroxylase (fatty acid hydroxylase superfamily)